MSDKELARDSQTSEVDTEPVLPLSEPFELLSSYDTHMSHFSDTEEQTDGIERQGLEESDEVVNDSLEVEAGDSSHSLHNVLPDEIDAQAEENTEADMFLDDSQTVSPRISKKRKARADDSSPPTPKKCRQESPKTTETQPVEVDPDSCDKKQSSGVIDISSTSEKTIDLEGSQEFSLRVEETSPPSQPSGDKSQEGESWKSHSKEEQVTPEQGGISHNSASWSSHHEPSLSWSSHKDQDEKSQGSKTRSEEHSKESNEAFSPEAKKLITDGGGKRQEVFEERLIHAGVVWIMEDNKVLFGEIKQMRLLEEPHGNEKAGRMSIMSSSSYKSSSSSGSVGLPGPFPLPGYSRLSTSTTSSEGGGGRNRPDWDGPFLKPALPVSRPLLVCCHCHNAFSQPEKTTSPFQNGTCQLAKIEELVPEKSGSQRRIRGKGSLSSQTQSSTSLEDGKPSSESLPQAASTPTPGKMRRFRKKANEPNKKEIKTPVKTKVASPGHTPMPERTLARPLSSPTHRNKGYKGDAVLAKWAGDGRYYPGWAKLSDSSTQTLVHFCDGQRKLMSSTWVVRADIITAGTLLLVTVDSTSMEYEECLVVEVNTEGPEPVYQVERDSNSRNVHFSDIALLEAQVSELSAAALQRTPATLNFNDVSLENIVSHPRKRSVRTPFREASSPSSKRKKRQVTPEPSTSNGQTFGGPESIYLDTDSSTHSSCSLDLRGKQSD